MCAQVRTIDSSGVLEMTVPEPKPVECRTDHPDANDGLPRLGIGERRLSQLAGAIFVLPLASRIRVVDVFVREMLSGCSSGRRNQPVPAPCPRRLCRIAQLGRGLEARGAIELSSAAVNDDERRHTLDAIAPRQRRVLINVDGPDRITLAGKLLDSFPHLLARNTPFGVEVEQDGLSARIVRGAERCGEEREQQGGGAHAGRTPFPRSCPRAAVATTAERVWTSSVSCASMRGEEPFPGWAATVEATFRTARVSTWWGLAPPGNQRRTASGRADRFAERSRCGTR